MWWSKARLWAVDGQSSGHPGVGLMMESSQTLRVGVTKEPNWHQGQHLRHGHNQRADLAKTNRRRGEEEDQQLEERGPVIWQPSYIKQREDVTKM